MKSLARQRIAIAVAALFPALGLAAPSSVAAATIAGRGLYLCRGIAGTYHHARYVGCIRGGLVLTWLAPVQPWDPQPQPAIQATYSSTWLIFSRPDGRMMRSFTLALFRHAGRSWREVGQTRWPILVAGPTTSRWLASQATPQVAAGLADAVVGWIGPVIPPCTDQYHCHFSGVSYRLDVWEDRYLVGSTTFTLRKVG